MVLFKIILGDYMVDEQLLLIIQTFCHCSRWYSSNYILGPSEECWHHCCIHCWFCIINSSSFGLVYTEKALQLEQNGV